MFKVYTYQGCSTCRTAVKWLREAKIPFTEAPIRETPPSIPELKAALKAYDGKVGRLFNTSGQDYRALGLKDRLPGMTEQETLELLAANGNLVKRPFAVDAKRDLFLVGFRQEEWASAILLR